jgi:hypothetical protein
MAAPGGPTIGQVRISDSGLDFGGSDVLIVEARLLFYDPNPPGGNPPLGYQLDAVWLNIDETLLGSGLGNTAGTGTTGIAWFNGSGSNDYNYILFSRDPTFANPVLIETVAQSTEASSWKNFDLGLCSAGQNPSSCALDLPVLPAADADPTLQAWVTLGYLNSGNLYNLAPENFNFRTTNDKDPGTLTLAPDCEPMAGELLSAIKVDPRATSGLFDNCVTSDYGPRYGAAGLRTSQETSVPEPGTLALVGLGSLLMSAARRRRII